MRRYRSLIVAIVSAVGLGSAAAALAGSGQAAPHATAGFGYHLVKTVALGAPTQWDYAVFSPTTRRLFIAHGNRLTVVSTAAGRVVGQVGPIAGGPHGIAFDPGANLGITDDGRLGEAVIFNLRTLRIVKRIKVQRGADAVAFDPVSHHAFIIDGQTGDIAVVDPVRGTVVTFIHIGGDLEYAVPGNNGELYVNGVTHREIIRINTATNRVDAGWPIPQCRSPHGLSIDTRTHRLFASCENARLVVVDSLNGAVVTTLPIGRGTDADRFDPRTGLIFSSNGLDGTLSIIHEVNANEFIAEPPVKTAISGRTMGIDPQSGRVFVVAARTTRQTMDRFMAQRRKTHQWPHWSPFAPNSLRLLIFAPGR
ncbi:MAG: YncE family protein [Steroidobacteraceae bacterium]